MSCGCIGSEQPKCVLYCELKLLQRMEVLPEPHARDVLQSDFTVQSVA